MWGLLITQSCSNLSGMVCRVCVTNAMLFYAFYSIQCYPHSCQQKLLYFFTSPALPNPTTDGSFYPNWVQCVTPTPLNSTVNDSTVMTCNFTKQQSATVLRVAWDGNIGVVGCENCCMRWFITIDGKECSNPGPIDVAIRQDLSELGGNTLFEEYRPASVVGYCRGSASSNLTVGAHTIGLSVGACADSAGLDFTTSEVLTGYNSVSRFIIEELPDENQEQCNMGQVLP